MERFIRRLFCFKAALFLFVVIPNAHADWGEDKTLSPYFFVEGGDPSKDQFPLKATDVQANINGVIADVVIKQTYTNEGKRPINAKYIFPASTRAAVHGMKMIIGEHVIKAEIREKEEAKRTFEKAKKQGKRTSLLKQKRPNVFSMKVANIMPQDRIDIELRYTELLIPTEGVYEFMYPTVVGPRYSGQPELTAPESDRWIKNPYLKEGSTPRTAFNIAVNLSTGMALKDVLCRTHDTHIEFENEDIARISLKDSEKWGGNCDFILNYRLAGDRIQSGLMLYEGEEENFFLLMVQPPHRIKQRDIPPREYIFVVDVSGSMHGFPLNTSKKLLRDLIGNLRDKDLFNVILFAGGSKLMSSTSVQATKDNIDNAIRLIDQQRGGGGTELKRALERGISLPGREGCSRTMIIVTDGYISAEREVFELIHNNLDNLNMFSFGIGSSVNRYLIEGMAKAGLGEPFVVTKPSEAPGEAERFRQYVEAPVLTDVAVEYNQFEAYQIEPEKIPDMFAERPLIIFGKYHDGLHTGSIRVKGHAGDGAYEKTFSLDEAKPLEINSAIRYLWARTRIARLSDFNFKRSGPEEKAEITMLGLTYNLLTSYTSFVAVQDVIANKGPQGPDVKQPLPLPLHVSNFAVGGSLSKVPEPEIWAVLSMVVLAMITIRLYRRRGREFSDIRGR